MIGDVGFVQSLELLLVLRPGEFSRVDDDAADRVAMAAEVLGERMHDDIGAVLDGPAQIGRRHGVVDDERNAMSMRDVGEVLEVGDVAERVADRFAVDGLGAAVDLPLEGLRITVVGEAHLDAELRQGCLLYTSPSPRDRTRSRMPSSA